MQATGFVAVSPSLPPLSLSLSLSLQLWSSGKIAAAMESQGLAILAESQTAPGWCLSSQLSNYLPRSSLTAGKSALSRR